MRTFTATVTIEQAKQAIDEIVKRSQWFEFEPLPDGKYNIKVKSENAELLKKYVEQNVVVGLKKTDEEKSDIARRILPHLRAAAKATIETWNAEREIEFIVGTYIGNLNKFYVNYCVSYDNVNDVNKLTEADALTVLIESGALK